MKAKRKLDDGGQCIHGVDMFKRCDAVHSRESDGWYKNCVDNVAAQLFRVKDLFCPRGHGIIIKVTNKWTIGLLLKKIKIAV